MERFTGQDVSTKGCAFLPDLAKEEISLLGDE